MSDTCEYSETQVINNINYLFCDITGSPCYHSWYCNVEHKFKMYPESNNCKEKQKIK